jgi:MFS family permease
LLKNVPLGRFLFLVFSGIFALYLSWPLTPIFLQQERLVSVSSLGVFGSLNAVGMVILNLALGGASPRLGFLLVHFIVGASILSLWRGAGVLWFGLGYFLAAGYRTARSFITAQVEQLIQRRQMGLAYGLAETVNGSVLLIASPIAGFLYRNRPELPFIVSLALIGSSFLLLLRFGPRRQRIQEG